MSSTSNAQDLLVNVFRPTYKWDSNTGFVPSLVVSNVTEVIASKIKANALVVSDNNVNTYIGADAGVNASNTLSNVGIGFSAMGGALNATSNVAIGTYALEGLSNSDSNVAIGAATDISGVGMRNVLIGTNVTLTGGSNNILIGVDLSRAAVSDSLQIGTLLYGNLSNGYIGINTTVPTRPLDVSGEVVFRNKVGIQKDNPVYTLDVAGSVYATEQIIGGKGTVTAPMYTFIDSSGSGMYVPEVSEGFGTGAFAIAVNRAPAAIFSSNRVNFYQNLDVSGTFSARNIDISAFSVTDGTQSKPAMTFISDLSSGLYLVSSNRVGVSTGGLRRMEILSNGDVSAGRLVARDISLGGTITTSTGCNVIGGVTLSNGNVILTGVATNTNLLVPGWFRNSDPATQIDISGGNISNSLTTRSSNFRASSGAVSAPAYSFVSDPSVGLHLVGTSTLGFDTSGVQRMCISGAFVGIGTAAPRVTLDVSGDISANVYNGPGGTQSAPHYTFSDDRTTGVFFPGANMIGMTAGGTERMRISNGNVGIGTTTPANALDVAGTIRVIGTTGGDLTFSNGNINLAGVPVISSTGVLSNATTTSNSIGGVTLSNTNITYAGSISNTVSTTSNQIGGVTLSNSTISNSLTSSNRIGGTVLSNYDVSLTGGGRILGLLASANTIGGVTLCNNQVSNSSFTTSSQFIASADGTAGSPGHTFGTEAGLGLYKSAAGTIGVATGGVLRSTFSNGDFSNAGLITTSNVRGAGGSQSAPAYSFTGDTNTGFYRFDVGQIGATTAGTTTMLLTTATTTFCNNGARSATLISNQVQIENGSAATPSLAFRNDTGTGVFSAGPSQLALVTGGVQRAVLSNSVLAVGRTPLVDTSLILQTAANAYISTGRVYLGEAVNSVAAYGGTIVEGLSNGGGGACDLLLYSRPSGASPTTPLERMRILGSGNVGINTRTPTATLDISGSGDAFRVGNGATNGSLFKVDCAWNAYGNLTMNGYFTILKAGTTSGTQPYVSFSPEYRIAGHWLIGNDVGIGTTTPSQPLDVSGIFRVFNDGTDVMGLMDPKSGNYLRIGAWNRAGNSSKTIALNPNGGTVGIGTTTPSADLDVFKTGTGVTSSLRIAAGMDGAPSSTNFARLRLTTRGGGGGTVDADFQNELVGGNYGVTVGGYTASNAVRFDLTNGRLGVLKLDPAFPLDVAGLIRGSSNIVAVDISYWSIGSNTGFVDTTLAISYTPKQTGTVNVILTAGADITVGTGSGGDSAQVTLQKGSTVISYWLQTFDGNNMTGRGGNMMFGGRTAFTTISGTTSLGMRLLRGGDDGNTYANAYLSVMELSTT